MKIPRTLALGLAGVALVVAACGDDDATDAGGDTEVRTIEVDMVDIAFEPDSLEIGRGETVRFEFTNSGEVAHDAFVGDTAAQADHETAMREADDEDHGGGHDDDADAITVEPGDTGELTHTFDEAGTFEVGCHQPGHYDAGMTITIEVA